MEDSVIITYAGLAVLGGALGLIIGLAVGQSMGGIGKVIGLVLAVAAGGASAYYLAPPVQPYVHDFMASFSGDGESGQLEARLREEPLINAFLTRFPDETDGYVTRLRIASEEGTRSAIDNEVARIVRQVELQTYNRVMPLVNGEHVASVFDAMKAMVEANRTDPVFCRAYGIRPSARTAALISRRETETPGYDAYIASLIALYDQPFGSPITIERPMRDSLLAPVGTAMRERRMPGEDWYWNHQMPQTDIDYQQSCLMLIRMLDLIEAQRHPDLAMRAFFALTQ